MRVAFLTEMNFNGKIPDEHNNMRTEFCWMKTLNADHFNIHQYEQLKDYDAVFIIFPKATVKLNRVGTEMIVPGIDRDITIYSKPIVETLKKYNKEVCYVQEGPTDFFNDYDITTQFNFYNQLSECNVIFAHNKYDMNIYKGLFPQTRISFIPSLIIPNKLSNIDIMTENKAIIGGNFCKWHGGFQSFIVATEFQCQISVPSSHCKRPGEEQVPGLIHLPWLMWNDWMKHLSTFKYAVNMMPTVAAGTFSLNCSYFGIPCIGNEKLDTQQLLFPDLSIDVNDVYKARYLAVRLREDKEFYNYVSHYSKKILMDSYYINTDKWLNHMKLSINETKSYT